MSYRNGLMECVDGLEYAGRLIEEFIEHNSDIKQLYISIFENIVFCVKEIIKNRHYIEISRTGNSLPKMSSIEPSLKLKYDNIMYECNSKLRALGVENLDQDNKESSKSFFKTVLLVFFGILLLAGLVAFGEIAGNS
jgi:hypothetical protein